MSDITTIARPYAKALFEHALAMKQLAEWSVVVRDLAEMVLHPETQEFITNPATTPELQTQLLMSIAMTSKNVVDIKAVEALIGLLAVNKRLLALPEICAQFEALRAEQEKNLMATVISFSPMTQHQQEQLVDSLSRRLNRHVSLEITIDQSLLGGAIIRAGDLVIDGSVRGKLDKLGTHLVA